MSSYSGLGWYVHLKAKNYKTHGINPTYLNPSLSLAQAITEQRKEFTNFLSIKANDNVDIEKFNRFLRGLQPGITGNQYSAINYNSISAQEDFSNLVKEKLGRDLQITEDLNVLNNRKNEKLQIYRASKERQMTMKKSVTKMLKGLEGVKRRTEIRLQQKEITKSEAKDITAQANNYIANLKNILNNYDSSNSEFARVLDYAANKDFIVGLNNFINAFNYKPDIKVLGDAAELFVAYALTTLAEEKNKTAGNLIKEVEKALVGKNPQSLSIKVSDVFNEKQVQKLAKNLKWSVEGDSTLITSSQGTIDIQINDQNLNDTFNSNGLRLSVKNYSGNSLGILGGSSMLSILSIFNNVFANHYLNLLALKKAIPADDGVKKTFEKGILYRGLAGYRGSGQGVRGTPNLFVVNTHRNGLQAYSVNAILFEAEKNLNALKVSYGSVPKSLNEKVGHFLSGEDARQRIIRLLSDIQKIKISASLNKSQLIG